VDRRRVSPHPPPRAILQPEDGTVDANTISQASRRTTQLAALNQRWTVIGNGGPQLCYLRLSASGARTGTGASSACSVSAVIT
jgi:hypothetical protein